MVAHDALQSSLFTNFYTIELQCEHLCAVIGALSLEKQVSKPLERQVVASREDVVGDEKGDFVTHAVGQLDVLPDGVVEGVGCRK